MLQSLLVIEDRIDYYGGIKYTLVEARKFNRLLKSIAKDENAFDELYRFYGRRIVFHLSCIYGTIKNSMNCVSIRGSGDIGGIAGQNAGTIERCWNGGNIAIVYESSRSIGGIVGYNHGEGNVIKCNNGAHISSVNTIKGKINAGAIIGRNNKGDFDGKGYVGSFDVTYTSYDGFIFGWGAYDNGNYLFAYYGYRVGRNK